MSGLDDPGSRTPVLLESRLRQHLELGDSGQEDHRYDLESALSWDAVGASLLLESDRFQLPEAFQFDFEMVDDEDDVLEDNDREERSGQGEWRGSLGRQLFRRQRPEEDHLIPVDPDLDLIPSAEVQQP